MLLHPQDPTPPRVLCRARPNSYSKITVASVKHTEFPRQTFAEVADVTDVSENNAVEGEETETKKISMEDREEGTCFEFPSPLPSPADFDVFPLLEKPRDSFLFQSTNSLNSLDNILVDPPEMFDPHLVEERADVGTEERREEERTTGITCTTESAGVGEPRQSGGSSNVESVPRNGAMMPDTDRHSTESNDTGYTSSTSPGYQERSKINIAELGVREQRRVSTEKRLGGVHRVSNASCSSEVGMRHYIPLVFHSVGQGGNSNTFSLQVCLVENSEELIKVRREKEGGRG